MQMGKKAIVDRQEEVLDCRNSLREVRWSGVGTETLQCTTRDFNRLAMDATTSQQGR